MVKDRIFAAALLATLTVCATAALKYSGAFSRVEPPRKMSPPYSSLFLNMAGWGGDVITVSVPDTPKSASGFTVRSDGVIAVPRTVVEGHVRVKVRLCGGQVVEGHVYSDRQSPLALVRVPVTGLRTCSFYDGPFRRSAASARRRLSKAAEMAGRSSGIAGFRQGEELGAPVFDMLGRVCGVYLHSPSADSAQGPLLSGAEAVEAVNGLLSTAAKAESSGALPSAGPKLGIQVLPTTKENLDHYPVLGHPSGAIVGYVVPGSPAERGGVRVGDVLVALGGRPVSTAFEVAARVRGLTPGRDAQVVVLRNGGRLLLPVVTGSGKEAPAAS